MLAVKVLAFDTGGTILDWHSGLVAALEECGRRRGVERAWYEFANEYRRRALHRMVGAVDPAFNIDDVHRDARQIARREADRRPFAGRPTSDRPALARTRNLAGFHGRTRASAWAVRLRFLHDPEPVAGRRHRAPSLGSELNLTTT